MVIIIIIINNDVNAKFAKQCERKIQRKTSKQAVSPYFFGQNVQNIILYSNESYYDYIADINIYDTIPDANISYNNHTMAIISSNCGHFIRFSSGYWFDCKPYTTFENAHIF